VDDGAGARSQDRCLEREADPGAVGQVDVGHVHVQVDRGGVVAGGFQLRGQLGKDPVLCAHLGELAGEDLPLFGEEGDLGGERG
jgi:hypothetical protein